jgi:hypothetical protein
VAGVGEGHGGCAFGELEDGAQGEWLVVFGEERLTLRWRERLEPGDERAAGRGLAAASGVCGGAEDGT